MTLNILLIGPQGAGKDTQAKRLSSIYSIPHISTGEMFREMAAKGTKLGLEAKAYWENGNLVPDDLTIRIVRERLSMPDCRKGYILNGFPRTLEQARNLDKFSNIAHVIELQLSDKEAVRRLSARRQCPKCGQLYGLDMVPKKDALCDHDGTPLIQREDDKPAAIKKRLKDYHSMTEPILQHYTQLVSHIDASGSVDSVFYAITKVLGQ